MFDETSLQFAKCSFPFSVSCEGRPELQKAKPGVKCPRQNGYFVHEDPTVRKNNLHIMFVVSTNIIFYATASWLHIDYNSFPFQICDKFYFCVDGVANELTCPESLIFNPDNVRTKIFT